MFDPKAPFTHTPRCAGKVTATLCPKNGSHLILINTLANVDRFSKFFHHLIREKILYVQTQRLLRYVTTLPCESKKSKMLLILTIRYDSVYLTCGKKLTCSQLSVDSILNKLLTCCRVAEDTLNNWFNIWQQLDRLSQDCWHWVTD